ncbi:Metal transporter Nramp7.1 [Dirofilaria immitis]
MNMLVGRDSEQGWNDRKELQGKTNKHVFAEIFVVFQLPVHSNIRCAILQFYPEIGCTLFLETENNLLPEKKYLHHSYCYSRSYLNAVRPMNIACAYTVKQCATTIS